MSGEFVKSPLRVNIRAATAKDLAVIGGLGALLVALHHDLDPARFLAATPRTPQGYASFLGTQLTKPDVIILVAEHQGDVIGYTYADVEGTDYMSLRGPAGVLHDIVVDPDHRGRGVGQILLDATVAALNTRGAQQIVLSTADGNATAQRLFERAGFRRTMIEMTRDLKA
jgi:ribosomal protein S18 acetylase RimI-like enzyme